MPLFQKIFGKKNEKASAGFINPITTELHSHLIFGIDDGVQTIEESIDILSQMEQMGYKKVITTPHIMGDFYNNGPENILPRLEEIRKELIKRNHHIQLDAAAEYMVDDAFLDKIEAGNLLSFGNKYVLVELPFTDEPRILKSALFNLRINGYKPILAHPERYAYYAQQKNKYEELFDSGILFQVNLYSLIGYYSPAIQKTAEWLLDKKMIHFIGSDTHGMRHIPVFHEAISSKNYEKACSLNLLNNSL
jgi:tyrosine-protein phosphatase YwqE